MKTTNTPTEPTPPSPRRHVVVRALINLVCMTLAWPAYPQASTTLVQSPPFTATEPPGNVFVMLDDSASMGAHTLPVPTGITISPPGPTVVIQGDGADNTGAWALRSWTINRDHDWIMRAPALNPLWYNPAILYKPWNKDGTPLPNASIGGSTPGTHWGAFTSRADAAQLTERDPRQAPITGGYASVTAGAGRGLLGTDVADPTSNLLLGRRVNLASPSVDFRYYKMPFDFGPTKTGFTTPPGNGHASIAWTTHNDTSSPLDLFSRPLTPTTTVTASGCFTGTSQCQSGASPAAALLSTTWQRTNCAGTVETFTENPGPLTCYRTRCGTGSWSAWSSTLVTPPCFQWTDCFGVVQYSSTNPGPISCGWRRQNCNGTWSTFPSAPPDSLTCYRTRGCDGSGWSGWSGTNPGTLPACYTRQNCAGTTQYFSGSDPGTLSCSWSRQTCEGVTQTFPSNPGNLNCWQRTRCESPTIDYWTTTAPSPLTVSCRYERLNCPGVLEIFPPTPNPGPLTCYQRPNCDGSITGPTASVLTPLTCPVPGELPITYTPTIIPRNPTLITRTATPFTRTATGGETRTSSLYTRVQTSTNSALAPSTITPIEIARGIETATKNSTGIPVSTCPTGTSNISCTVTPPAPVPDPALLTPARYYTYTGSGNKGDPANYRVVQIDRTRPTGYLFPVVDAVTGQAVSAADSQRTDCAANGKTHCTWVEEARNFANWWLYYRNRLFTAQAVMGDAMSSMTTSTQQQLRLAYGRINYFPGAFNPWRTVPLETIASLPAVDGFTNPGGLVRGARPFVTGSAPRAAFFDWLFSLSWVGATPNREAIDSIGRYFSWADNRGPWGATPGTADGAPQLACRRNFAFLTTDGEWTNVLAGQPLLNPTGPLAGPGSPEEADNVVGPLITGDGKNSGATFTYKPTDWPALTGGANQAATLTDVATYYWNRDLRPDLPNVLRPITEPPRPNPAFWQSMSTYIVGYGLSASMDTAATRTAVSNGSPVTWPTVDLTPTIITGGNRVNDSLRAALASRGDFYAASDTASLKNAILNAFREMVTLRGSAGGVAVTGPGITGSSQAYFPSYVTGKWTGALRAYASADLEALAAGGSPAPAWSASVPTHTTRKMLTSTARNSATTFTAANLSSAQATALTGPEYTATEIVAYVRGDQSLELPETGPTGGRKFRRRETLLGDFVNSTPLYVKAPDFGYATMPVIGSAYASYVSTRRAGTTATVFIGGNAGAFHAFDAATGVERFAYVPRGVYADLPRLADPGYSHRYYVDGPVTGGDWHDGSAWRSIVVGTTGAGGSSIFAIDVTNPGSVSASDVRWDVTKAESNFVGNVLSRGVVGRIPNGAGGHRWVYIAGNGYESVSNRSALLVIDIATGAVDAIPVGPTWTEAAGLEARNGMGGVTVSYDAQRNVREVYAGDRQGNVWRFDFSNGVPTGAKGFDGGNTPLFVATDGLGKPRPITAAPRLALHPLSGLYLIFGTGKLHDDGDSAGTDSQAIYGLWLKPDLTSAITSAQIATISVSGGDGDRTFSLNAIDWTTKRGWQVPLTGGERVISDPSADLGTMVVASFKPGAGGDPCDGGGTSYLYRINYSTGEAVGIPATGVVGAVTPLVALPAQSRTLASKNLPSVFQRQPGEPTNGGASSSAQCRLYSTSIQGLPNVIAQNCPGLAPVRMWRQSPR
ncbi:MAG: PilC/PilY family type IV pilus protein [Burkholderiales bacterium]